MIRTTLLSFLLFGITIFIPSLTLAQPAWWDSTIGGQLGLSSQDPEITTINIIVWILGLLALIAVIMMIYAGIVYLTSGGEEEKIEKSKNTIKAAVIGLVIVFLAWAILTLTINVFKNAGSV